MRLRYIATCQLLLFAAFCPTMAFAAGAYETEALQAKQREAMALLGAFNGEWRGTAMVIGQNGQPTNLIQTERFGPMLGNTVRLVEGRGHRDDGSLAFNALAVISFNPHSGKYNFRSYAQGHEGDFPIEVKDSAFVWSIAAGPATIRYAATISNNIWHEIGERIVPGQPPIKIFEMQLKRIGDSDWPASGSVGP